MFSWRREKGERQASFFFVPSKKRGKKKRTRKPKKHAIYPGRPFRLSFCPPASLSFEESGAFKRAPVALNPCRPCYACENRAPRFAARQGGYRVAAPLIILVKFSGAVSTLPWHFFFLFSFRNKNGRSSSSAAAARFHSRWEGAFFLLLFSGKRKKINY